MKFRSLHPIIFLAIVTTVFFFSCKKDMKTEPAVIDPVDTPAVNQPGNLFHIPAVSPVTGSVSGLVVDENNAVVNGAEVRLGTTVITTDARGLFNFPTTTLDKYITTITVNMPGYFKGIRSFCANATRNYVCIKLIPKTLAGTVNSSSTGSVGLSNGTTLSFQANSMQVKATGAPYTGTVNVYVDYIDPTASDISARVPGSFMGEDGTNMFSLRSAAMMAVELESAAGESLQLAAGKPASIKFNIPASILNHVPDSINTWSLDDRGIWIKEGMAVKNGNFYEASVTHFSFWNCDAMGNAAYLNMHVQDQDGNALVNTTVILNSWGWGNSSGITDSLGNVSGIVPAGYQIQANFFANIFGCSTPIASQNIGPFNNNASDTISLNISSQQELSVTGSVTNCSGQPLQSGTAALYSGNYSYYYASIVNGSYTFTIPQCGNLPSVNVTAIDNTSGAQAISGNIAVTGNTVNIPVMNVCDVQPSAFTFSTNWQTTIVSGTYAGSVPLNSTNTVTLQVDVTAAGTYYITTDTSYGISFSATGTFTTLGVQNVVLTGSGTPTAFSGVASCRPSYLGMNGYYFHVDLTAPPAVFEMGGPGACTATVAGSINVPGTNGGHIYMQVNFISPGYYNIHTDTINGISFSASGIYTGNTPPTVVLNGTGTPLAGGDYVFTTHASNGGTGCTVPVHVTTNPDLSAYYNFQSSLDCGSGPNFPFGVPVNNATAYVYVDVSVVGTWSISAAGLGISFGGSGTFTTTGPQTVTLSGGGTGQNSGITGIEVYGDHGVHCIFYVSGN
ncbi:MAG: carboxypeptidase-like regulatory domain-containing protein [Ferruginibacter sp.]